MSGSRKRLSEAIKNGYREAGRSYRSYPARMSSKEFELDRTPFAPVRKTETTLKKKAAGKMRKKGGAMAPKKKSLGDKAKPGLDWDNPEAVRGYFDHIDSSIAQKHAQAAENERRICQRGKKVPPIALSTSTNYPSLKVLNERLKQRAKKIKRSK